VASSKKPKPVKNPGYTLAPTEKAYGVSVGPQQLNTGVRDTQRNFLNFLGSVGNYFGGTPDAAPGKGMGDQAVKKQTIPGFEGFKLVPNAQPKSAPKKSSPKKSPQSDPADQQVANPLSFNDYLALAQKLGLGGNSVDYSAQENALKSQASAADAQLASMYNALKQGYANDATGVAQNYDTAGQSITGAGGDAANSVNAAYQAARDAQTQQLQALGIQDAVGSLDGRAASDQAHAVSGIVQNQNANTQENTSNKAAALNYNTGIQQAAGLQGATQRGALQQSLADKLAALQSQKSQANSDNGSKLVSGALQLAQSAQLIDPNYSNPKNDLQSQLLAQQVLNQQLKNQALAANSAQTSSPNLSQIMALAQKNGVQISNANDLSKFVAALKASGQF
jgi:hypothetical protein